MLKRYLILFGFLLFAFAPLQTVKAETDPKVEEMYITTEDIILDIIFPTIDKKVIKEYGQDTLIGWDWQRIVGITYNEDHSYDVSVRIQIPSQNLDNNKEDLVKVRISPSCDSDKLNKLKCNHNFKIELLDYKHLSK
ncbi:hypothetical protein DFO73_105133 [Cytobacillus oceanisediminis]|jgi:hypothetical protein|uniref:DUF3888 domain-containing protein n=1 Tax=Cytobacillus oceanisediminis TaxID=665099 RepID=A0A2V3A5N6_9BACI|nr:hypothetical protein [Cytobacillus oceanisediminis]PWW28896.1 hypothetical protein DFO73_105133 [Cytobacillus oceanisediminis]